MTIRKRMVLPLALALGAVGIMVVASVASATHPRPKGATPLRVSIVPAFAQCTAPNRTHGPPLAFPSCNPPVQSSTAITVGSPDANGAAANSEGNVKLEVLVGVPGPPDDSDVIITSSLTDVPARPVRPHVVQPTLPTVRTTPVVCRAMPRSGSRTTSTRSPRVVERTRQRSLTFRTRSPLHVRRRPARPSARRAPRTPRLTPRFRVPSRTASVPTSRSARSPSQMVDLTASSAPRRTRSSRSRESSFLRQRS